MWEEEVGTIGQVQKNLYPYKEKEIHINWMLYHLLDTNVDTYKGLRPGKKAVRASSYINQTATHNYIVEQLFFDSNIKNWS